MLRAIDSSTDEPSPDAATAASVAIVVVAADGDLGALLERVPPEVRARTRLVIPVGGDEGLELPEGMRCPTEKLSPQGYGADLKAAYALALERGAERVAVLHGHGQYPPELLPSLLAPLDNGVADAAFACRTIDMRRAIDGGMELYKYAGNRLLSRFENLLLNTRLSELHSGYRVFTADALSAVPFDRNSDLWHFDTQVITQLVAAKMRLAEVRMGSYSSEEIRTLNGLTYAAHVAGSVIEYKLHELGLRSSPRYRVRTEYDVKQSALASHARLLDMVGPYPLRILDVGCGDGTLSRELEQRGHTVTAIDFEQPRVELNEFILANVNEGIPVPEGRQFDLILLADVLEHVPDPADLLRSLSGYLDTGGRFLVSLPNVVHWSVRASVALGRFEYANRGLLDRGHLRFFTRRSALRLFRDCGLMVAERATTPTPWERIVRRWADTPALRALELADDLLGRASPNLFAYQNLFALTRVGEAADDV
jgi:SAM-dependent methyltransferase